MINLNTNKSISIVYVACTILVGAFYCFPQLRILIRFDQLAYLTVLYYLCFVAKYVSFNQVVNLMKYAIPFCLLMFVAKGLNFKYGFLYNLLELWNLIIPSIICIGLFLRNRPRELFIITWTAIIMLTITCLTTLTVMDESENVMRELTASTTDETYAMELREMGVGGFGIAYAMGAFAVGLFALFKQVKKWNIWKWIILAMLVFSFYFVTQAQFTTLLIITIVGAATTYLLNARTKEKKIKVIIITIGLIFLLPVIVQILIDLYQDTTIGMRLSRMYDSLWGAGNVTDISGKRSMYQINAIKLFLESPIWGNNITQQPNAFINSACHSTLLAVASSTGIIGIWSYLKTFHATFQQEINLAIDSNLHKSYYPIVVYYLLFAFFNPINTITEASWIIFVIIPSLFKLYLSHNYSSI